MISAASATATATAAESIKCGHRSCKVKTPCLKQKCFLASCQKRVHDECYHQHVLSPYSLPHFSSDFPHAVACTKTHYRNIIIQTKKTQVKKCMPWNRDGKLGPDDPNASESIIVGWLMTPGNVEKYRNGSGGVSKEQHCSFVSKLITRAECRKLRSAKDVRDRIYFYEDKFKTTYEWAYGETGQGVRADEGLISFNEKVSRRFKHYFDLEHVCADRAMSRPLKTSDDVDDENESETSVSKKLSLNHSDDEEDDLIHSDDECLKNNLISLTEPSVTPVDIGSQLTNDAAHTTPRKSAIKK